VVVLLVAVDASMAAVAPACTDTETLLAVGPFSKRNTELRTK
jgi:hypothetical protein